MNAPSQPSEVDGQLVGELLLPGMELIETHISWVFLGGGDVWKVKKPVDFGFLDFSTADKRHAACLAEVELNRRLAPHVYLGCIPITRDNHGRARFGGSGEPIDWAVQMVRLPEEDRADLRLASGRLSASHLDRVAVRLARFHESARCDEETTQIGGLETVKANVEENFAQTRAELGRYLDPDQAAQVKAWQRQFLDRKASLFAARQAAGRVRDGHGDLRLEHVYLTDDDYAAGEDDGSEVVIVDCIEFNHRFRFADVCADVAFLAMDLSWHGRPDLAERFLAAYARAANDFDLYPLVDFYESYRAFVRGKIASFGIASGRLDFPGRQEAIGEARRYFLLALASERRALAPPRLLAIGGMIASGKSTIAENLGAELAVPVVDADRTRKFLLGRAPAEAIDDPAWQGAYSPTRTAEVYSEVLRRAEAVLQSGRSVIVDASFRAREHRLAARQLADYHGVPFRFIECRAKPEICRQRLRDRERRQSVSDGRLEIFDEFVARWQPVDELPASEHLVLDTSQPLVANLQFLRKKL